MVIKNHKICFDKVTVYEHNVQLWFFTKMAGGEGIKLSAAEFIRMFHQNIGFPVWTVKEEPMNEKMRLWSWKFL